MTISDHNSDVARIVASINETRIAEHFRSCDRPDGKFVTPRRRRQDPVIARAKARLRTAAYRGRMDERRAPSAAQIGMSLLVSLATTPTLSSFTPGDRDLVGRALADLQSRGFDIRQALSTVRRLRRQLVDRNVDAGDNTVVTP